MKRWLLLLLFLALTAGARLWNWSQVISHGQVYFVDADCYSRMTRASAVLAHPGLILRHHDFENWPFGTTPHTTAPLDYLIADLGWILGNLDLAGAWTPVGIGLLTAVCLWKWVKPFRWTTQVGVLLVFAVSPILVHGTVFGRPDHQALLILFIIAAFAAEWEMQKADPPRWRVAILHGAAWGLALWTSLFEPLILLSASTLLGVGVWRRRWFTRSRGISAITLGSVLLLALAIERWHLGALPTGPLFERWARSIGELAPVGWFSATYLQWFGLAFLAVPLVLGYRIFWKKESAAVHWGGLFFLTFVLSAGAARWGYFLGIAFIFTLPFLLEKARSRWVAVLFFTGFWTIAGEWDMRLWPSPQEQERLAEQHEDYRQLRQISEFIRREKGGGIVAPWWLSPAVAYWSGGDCVAGSSHQSLPGNEDTANFYLARFPEKAGEILRRRRVRWVVAYEPSRVLSTASSLVQIPPANDALAVILYEHPRQAPGFLQLARETTFFKLYRFEEPPLSEK